jgi:hypothetical protein
MRNNVWTKMLRFAVFAALLAASAMAALMPDWATTLKAQSYSGYVDLQLDAQTFTRALSAGTDAGLLVTLANTGTADAHRARTIVLLEGDAVASATSGCLEDPVGFPDCTLSTPLPAGGSADYLMTLAVSPLARGHLNVAVAAASDDAYAVPGRELILLELPIEAHVDLMASAACNRAYVRRNTPLSCRVTLRNAGPAASIFPIFSVNAFYATFSNLSCVAPRQELCPIQIPTGWEASVMMPGETVVLSFDLTIDPATAADAISIDSGAFGGPETEDNPHNNTNSLVVPVPLFSDDFEG